MWAGAVAVAKVQDHEHGVASSRITEETKEDVPEITGGGVRSVRPHIIVFFIIFQRQYRQAVFHPATDPLMGCVGGSKGRHHQSLVKQPVEVSSEFSLRFPNAAGCLVLCSTCVWLQRMPTEARDLTVCCCGYATRMAGSC